MNKLLTALFLACPVLLFADVEKISPAEAARLVTAGKAVLIDVRESSEWAETGVAAPAMLLAKSDFDAGQVGKWKDFLAQAGDTEIILYCRSGHRAGIVGAALEKSGHKVANAGGFNDWQAAGLPTRKVDEKR